MDIFELDKTYVSPTYNRFPVDIVYGKGSIAKDSKGKEYIDLGTGIGVNIFGWQNEKWIEEVKKQLEMFQHTSNLYYSKPCAELAKKLTEITKMKKVFFCNSGAEANECAFKVARLYAEEKKDSSYNVIVSLKNSFHGRTLATLAATGQDCFHEHFKPLPQGFVSIDTTAEELKNVVKNYKVAGIIFEAVRGEGGVIELDSSFAKLLGEICKKEDIVLIADEVQCGNGRTGKYYGYMNFSLSPDVVTTAKGLGGGLPIGACIIGEKTQNVFKPGLNGSTFGGNPICCAASLAILEQLDEPVLRGVQERSALIKNYLKDKKGIKSITGLGLMLGVETEKDPKEIALKCIENGLLVLTAKNKVRLLPPLNIPLETLNKALRIFVNCL